MHSSLIGKLEKAKRYAQERERITLEAFRVTFKGDNGDHIVSYGDGKWQCSCDFFPVWNVCSHTMALEKIMDPMFPREASSPAVAV